jgi:O-Antigen ligase
MPALQNEQPSTRWTRTVAKIREPQAGVFFWLSAFYFVYCARPEDWIPGIGILPLAKLSGIFALLGLLFAVGRTKRGFRDLPREAYFLVGIIFLLLIAAVLSPVWKGGAFFKLLDFSKMLVAWVLTFLVVTNFERLRRIIFIQCGSVALITIISVLKGRSHPRLEGVIGGIYSNPNDLAFAIVLSLPFCFAFLLRTRSLLGKMFWGFAMLAMCAALFMTASRAGFIDLIVTGAVCLWIFGVKGKRPRLIVAALLVAIVVGLVAGGKLKDRFLAISGSDLDDKVDESAYDSYEARRALMIDSVKSIAHYPWGIGLGNFVVASGTWHEVHTSYLQMGAEGGVGALLLYLLFFRRGFENLKKLRRIPDYDPEMELFTGALFGTLTGFLVGSLFAPEAYQFYPYFAVAYTSALLAMAKEQGQLAEETPHRSTTGFSKLRSASDSLRDQAPRRPAEPSPVGRQWR